MPVKTVPNVLIGSGSNKSIVNNIFISDFGNTIVTGYLTVDFYLTVDGNLTVGGSFDLAGPFELSGDITVKDPSDVTVFSVDSATGNTTIEGDLTVNGTTTTIDSVTLVVEDPVITLAKNANSNPTASTDTGLFLQRGSTENPAIIIWNETLNQFEVATVTGASSTTTNFTGGGVTKTFATFKAGVMYGSSIDIGGLGSFGSLSSGSLSIGEHTFNLTGITLGEYGNLNIHSIQDYSSIILNYDVTSGIPSANAVLEVKRGSSTSSKITWDEGNDRWDFNFGLYLNTDSQLKMEKPTSDSTPVILLNADKTGSLQESTVVALGVERGLETNSYLKWDETTDSWEFSNSLILNESLKFNNNLVPVYFYVRYTSTSLADNEYIYIFSTQDNGVTRDVIRIASLSGSLTENSSLGYYRYKASTSSTYSNGNPPIVDGIIYLDPNKTYYFNMDSTDIQGNDFQVYFSTTILVTPPTYRNVFVGFSVSTTSANIVYSLISNTTLQDSDILRRVDDGVVEINTMDGATTVDDIDIIPIRIPSKKDNQSNTVLLLNSDETGSPTKSVQIEVERGTSTNALITWNETYDYWGISPAVSTDLIYTTDLQAGYSTFNYLGEYQNEDPIIVVKNPSLDTTFSVNGGGDVFAKGQISTNLPSLSTTPAILLNADLSGPGQESSVIALSVIRGEEISSNIKWDESNDRWDFNFGLYLNTDSQLKIEKPSSATTPAILLNADRTGDSQEADIICLEVERGILANSYIQWDETNDRWKAEPSFYSTAIEGGNLTTTGQATFENNLIPVYIYVKYNSSSQGDNEYFYIFSTNDNGITRDVVRLSDLDSISENTGAGYYRYRASAGSTYSNTTPPTINGIAYLDPNKTYYFNMDSIDIEYPIIRDFEVYASTSILVSAPTYRNVFIGFDYNLTTTANIVYSLITDATWTSSEIVRRVDNGVVEISTMSGATTVDDIDTIPIRIHSKKDNQSNTAILLNSDETGSPTKSVQIEVERGTSTNSYIKWNEYNSIWEISQNLKVLDSSSNTTLLTDTSFIYTYKPLGLYNSLFYKVQRISNLTTDIDSDVSFVVIENGALGSAVFGPKLPNLESDSIGGRVINIAVKGANYVEIYPPAISQYIRHGGTTYSLGNPLVLSGYSSVQLVSHIVGTTVKDWYVTAISNSDMIDNITASGAITIFNGKTYHCNPAGAAINLTLSVAPNGTQLTFRSISTQITTITTVSTTTPPELPNNYIEGTHNTITLNSNSEGLTIYYYGTSWWVSSMYGNVGITTVP